MADQQGSLPVKTLNNGDVVARLSDGTLTSQLLAIDASGRVTVKNQDGAGNDLTSQANGSQRALDVGIDVAGVQIDPRSIRTLTSADTVTVVQPTGTNLHVVVDASALPTGAATSANQTTIITDLAPLNYAQAAATSGQLGNLIFAAASSTAPSLTTGNSYPLSLDLAGSLRILVAEALPTGSNTIGAVSQAGAPWSQNLTQVLGAAPSATNALASQIATSGAYVSLSNPLPVILSSSSPGTIVNDYLASTAVVAGASANHNYAVPAGKVFTARKFWAASAGAIKMDVQTSPDGTTFTTFWTGFNSAANPNISVDLDQLSIQDSGAGAVIRLIITNEEPLLAENVYSTISGTYI